MKPEELFFRKSESESFNVESFFLQEFGQVGQLLAQFSLLTDVFSFDSFPPTQLLPFFLESSPAQRGNFIRGRSVGVPERIQMGDDRNEQTQFILKLATLVNQRCDFLVHRAPRRE